MNVTCLGDAGLCVESDDVISIGGNTARKQNKKEKEIHGGQLICENWQEELCETCRGLRGAVVEKVSRGRAEQMEKELERKGNRCLVNPR
jgi:hypothetical protein